MTGYKQDKTGWCIINGTKLGRRFAGNYAMLQGDLRTMSLSCHGGNEQHICLLVGYFVACQVPLGM